MCYRRFCWNMCRTDSYKLNMMLRLGSIRRRRCTYHSQSHWHRELTQIHIRYIDPHWHLYIADTLGYNFVILRWNPCRYKKAVKLKPRKLLDLEARYIPSLATQAPLTMKLLSRHEEQSRLVVPAVREHVLHPSGHALHPLPLL